MEKILYEYLNDLNNEQLGELVRMSVIYDIENRKTETEDKVIKLIFKTQCKECIDRKKYISAMRSQNGKKGGGRPRKEVK